LQWIWQYFGSGLIQHLEQLIVDASCQSACKAASQRGVSCPAAENGLAMQGVCARLLAREKDRANLYAFRSKREGRGNAASVSYSSSGNNWNLYRVYRLRHE
jgi:hypothetical protein